MLILLFFTADAAAVAVVVTVPWRSFYECVLLFLVYFQRICRLFSLRFLLVYFVALYVCVCVLKNRRHRHHRRYHQVKYNLKCLKKTSPHQRQCKAGWQAVKSI